MLFRLIDEYLKDTLSHALLFEFVILALCLLLACLCARLSWNKLKDLYRKESHSHNPSTTTNTTTTTTSTSTIDTHPKPTHHQEYDRKDKDKVSDVTSSPDKATNSIELTNSSHSTDPDITKMNNLMCSSDGGGGRGGGEGGGKCQVIKNPSNQGLKSACNPHAAAGLYEYGPDAPFSIRPPKLTSFITTLFKYCYEGNTDKVRSLIDKSEEEGLEANVNILGPLGTSCIHIAIEIDNRELFEYLITRGGNPNLQTKYWKRTPLHIASKLGHLCFVRLLLSLGADVNLRDCLGRSPLHLASIADSKKCAELLLRAGSNPDAPDTSGRTPLHLAAKCGSPEFVSILLKAGACPGIKDKIGNTPLHFAAISGNIQVVDRLLQTDLPEMATLTNASGESPVTLSAYWENKEVLRHLMASSWTAS